jgi:hypothetical protein
VESVAPATGTALLLLVAFVLPGFVTLVVRETTYVVREATTPFERLLLSLSYSVRIYGVLILLAYVLGEHAHDIAAYYHGRRGLGAYILLGALALFVLPILISETGRFWRSSTRLRPAALKVLGISEAHSTPSGWDHFFGSDALALVRVTLDDQRVVGGYFGSDSLAAYSEHSQDLFLEQRWELDEEGWFVRPAPASLGIWLPHDHIVSLEVYAPPPDEETGSGPMRAFPTAVSVALLLYGLLRSKDAGR